MLHCVLLMLLLLLNKITPTSTGDRDVQYSNFVSSGHCIEMSRGLVAMRSCELPGPENKI